MTDRDAILAAVLDAPADDTARLVLADYLQDHGRADLGRFIWAGVTASRFRDHAVIDDPAYYRALNEIADVVAAGALAGWLAGLGLVRLPVAAREWAWDQVVDRVTVRAGAVTGVFERGMLAELSATLDQWTATAPTVLAAWPVDRVVAADAPGLVFTISPPGASGGAWELVARLTVPGRRVRLSGGLLAASLAPATFLTEDAGEWTVAEEFPTRARLAEEAGAATVKLVAELREVADDRWPRPPRR